jgi:concentrative nucleoside transporter, CNT family
MQALLGIFVLLGLGWLLSMNRGAIRPRIVIAALLTQVAIGAIVLFVPWGRRILQWLAEGVNYVLSYGAKGTEFLFGGLVSGKMFEVFGDVGFVFAFRVLPAIIYMTALIAVLYHLGVMRVLITALGSLFQRIIGVSRIESFSAVTTIFLGQSEMPAVVKPFVMRLSGPQIFCIMSSGMASVAGSILAGYAGLGVKMDFLLAASFMAIPGGLLFAKLICPGQEEPEIEFGNLSFEEKRSENVIEAAASGAAIGLKIALSVGAMLIAFIGLIALLNGMFSGLGGLFGVKTSLESALGFMFAPMAWLIGVPWSDAVFAGNLIGQKLILNEFVAYVGLSPYLKDAATVTAAGLTPIAPATAVILSFALCGFANFSSIAILAGGFGSVSTPEVRSMVARYGLRVVAAGTLSNLMSAALAGLFFRLAG